MSNYLSIHQDRFKFILKQVDSLSLPMGSRILDIGCYPTHLFDELSKKYLTYGISSPHEPIKQKNILVADIEKDKLNFPKNSFNLIICTEVLEHLINPKNFLSETKRLLLPGGYLILTTPNSSRLQNIIKLICGKNIYFHLSQLMETDLKTINHRHNREYTASELAYLIDKFNLKLIKSAAFTSYTPGRDRKTNLKKQFLAYSNRLVTFFIKSRQDTLYILAQNS